MTTLVTSTSNEAVQRSAADKIAYLYDGSMIFGYWDGTSGQVDHITTPLGTPSVTNLISPSEDGISVWADNSAGTSSDIWVCSSDDDASHTGPSLHVRHGTYAGGVFTWDASTLISGTTTAATITSTVTWTGTYLMVFWWDGASGSDRVSYAWTAVKNGTSGWSAAATFSESATWSSIVQVCARHSRKLGGTVVVYGGNSQMHYAALADTATPAIGNWGGRSVFDQFDDSLNEFGGPQVVIDENSGVIHVARAVTTNGGPTWHGVTYWKGTYTAGTPATVAFGTRVIVDAAGTGTSPADVGLGVDSGGRVWVLWTDAISQGNLKYATLTSPFTSASASTTLVAGGVSSTPRWPHVPAVSQQQGGLYGSLPVLYTDTTSSAYPVILNTSVPLAAVVNQWAESYGQGVTFGSDIPVLQSCVVSLSSTDNVGGGSGTAAAGNWLFVIASWTQVPGLAEVHIGVGDDIHSWWRQFPASSISGKVRTSVSYTPNTARAAGNVYVAPDGEVSAINVLVVEVSGLGPWDTVAGTNANYAAAATSLSLSLGTPGAASFFIAGAGGDNISASQAFTPAGYTALQTLSQTDGSDHLADNYLTSAFIASSSSSQSISASCTSENISGFLIGVYTTGTNPVPANQNPDWPYATFEAAFGSGFNTPDSERTWTDLSTRLWSLHETTGIQFQLGQLQATNLDLTLDNNDNYLASLNSASPYFPNVTAGTPVRLRAALGTMGGTSYNRWYVIQRNAQEWPEEIDESLRRFSAPTGTDIWATLSSTGPTPYRGEIYADSPYSWFPCDDQPGPGGVLPTTLLNAALGNTTVLSITPNPGGIGPGDQYSTTGFDITASWVNAGETTVAQRPSVATYTVGADTGWMYGDPESTPSSALAGNQITASPGSAAWQQTQLQGTGGANTWFLTCNDASFPGLSGGITVKAWFNAASFGTAGAYTAPGGGDYQIIGQPYSVITLLELATASDPVAFLQLDLSGHLNFITYNGTTPTSHSIYSSSDLRNVTWFSVDITMTTTAWTVYVNGGLTAAVSGTATGMTSAWTWLIVNGDLGNTHGGSSLSSIAHGGNVAYSHIAIFPQILPLWRILAHYQAAITGFGLLPVPQNVAVSDVLEPSNLIKGYTPDGSLYQGTYGTSGGNVISYSISAVVAAVAGSYTSGVSARGVLGGMGAVPPAGTTGDAVWVAYTGLAPKFILYTSADAGSETGAAVVLGSGDSFSSGYGSSASGHGAYQTGSGSGASPPTSPSALGDTVAQRIERCLGYGNVTYPGRCIDPASLLVQAALDVGGQQAGQNVQSQASSDGGMLFIDNIGNLNYWQRPHLAAQYSSPVWTLGPNTGAGHIPYYREVRWLSDPQRVWNAIEIQPYSPAGASLPIITPANGSGVITSQQRYGAQPYQINSYLQSTSEMQSQANWLYTNYAQPERRAERVRIEASAYPAAWQLVLGVNVSDVIAVEDWQIGGGGTVYTMRVTEIKRELSFGAQGQDVAASVELTLDFEPSSYWS